MKNIMLYLSLLLLVVATSCKKDTESVANLLNTVPSSAGGVVVFDLEGLIKNTGSDIKEHQIKPSNDLEEIISTMSPSDRKDFNVVLDGSSGIDPKSAVIFYDSSRLFLTVLLYDEEKFCEFVEKNAQQKFEENAGGVKILGNTAVKGAQAWMLLSSGRRIDPDAIASYSSLKSSQSFLVTPMGEKLLTEEDDIRGWALLGASLDEFLSRSQRMMFTMGAGFVFENAESLKFKVDFKKGEVEGSVVILNDKYEPAKYLLPTEKVDVSTLKGLGETCDAMMAFTVNSELIDKFDKLGTAFGGALFGGISQILKNVDGTIGIIGGGNNIGENFEALSGVITTKGEVGQELKDFISENMGAVSVDGKYVKFSKGNVSGNLSVAECADELKGCCLGMVVDLSGVKGMGYDSSIPNGLKNLAVKLEGESGGVKIEIEAKTSNPDENSMLTIMKINK